MTIAASSAVYESTARLDIHRFSLIVRLPDENLVRVRHIKDGSTLLHVKERLELLWGCPPSTYTFQDIDGEFLKDVTTLRLGDNISDNTVMKLCLLTPYNSVHESLSKKKCNTSDLAVALETTSGQEAAVNLLFMCCYHGNLDGCKYLLNIGDVLPMATTCSGNSCLHAAAANDQLKVALELCKHGADIYAKNRNGSTPLDIALEFGSFTCERELRLSQWKRRKAKMAKATEHTQTFSESVDSAIKTEPQPAQVTPNTSILEQEEDNSSYSYHDHALSHSFSQDVANRANVIRPSTASHLYYRPSTAGSTKQRMTTVNHAMPASSKEKSKERRARVRSAPLLNSEARNERLCRSQSTQPTAIVKPGKSKHKFTLTKPQYLQYIKSSTGIVEEDYFADIFPEQEEKHQDTRSFDDQMKRNERIFKRMFKESGVLRECSDTDSEEERARQHANKKAVKRWNKKHDQQRREERKKLSVSAYSSRKAKIEGLGELLQIGDTSQGHLPETNPEKYIRAYQTYKDSSEAVNLKSYGVSFLDPVSYEQWVATKPNQVPVKKTAETNDHKSHLVKKIDYQTWLDSASKRISKQMRLQKNEEKQKKDFEEWIQQLKQEVGTDDYWKRCREERMAKERLIKRKQREEEQRKQTESEKRRELAKDIYRHWAISKERSKLQQEENKLLKEKERLKQLRSDKP
ncbi:trichohyalin-like [Watersipora subatra]|uniref:trichohyalin-like n=1 Tax=Watersipora subatra TaxID=2589382 RepID=UPI00355BCDC3